MKNFRLAIAGLAILPMLAFSPNKCECNHDRMEYRMKRLETDQIRVRTWVNSLHVIVTNNHPGQ